MKETRKIGKRLLSAALAAALAVTTMGTQVFASPESSGTDTSTEGANRVLSWSWPEGTDATWDEDTQTWTLACSYTAEQPLTQETLTQLLPAQITAVVQTEVATSETAEEDAVTEDTAAEEESGEPASDAAVSEGPTAADSVATPDTASAGDRTPMKKAAPADNAENDTDTAAAESQTIAENLTLTWDFSGLTFPLQTGEYTLTASLPEAYQLEEGTPTVQLKLQVYPPIATMANGIAPLATYGFVNDTVSPIGTTINLFDYWLEEQSSSDKSNPANVQNIGINKGHKLNFRNTSQGGDVNSWTGSAKTYPEMVENVLQNGYPQLNETKVGSNESLSYLFDTNSGDYKAAYSNVKGLLRVDANNYYYYDSKKNYAQYDESTNSFQVLDTNGIGATGANGTFGQFFPFNKVNDNGQVERVKNDADAGTPQTIGNLKSINSVTVGLDHYFGLSMTTRFVQMEGGTNNGKPVTYEFSGDDDVWVFIDDVLVGDLGGIHDAASLKIDFQTGQIIINENTSFKIETNLKECFEKVGRANDVEWQSNNGFETFKDGTYHTLKFFYLERGNCDSNMSLKFNLVFIPQSDLIKVDQTGDPVPGAEFALYEADDENYTYDDSNPIATGTTDSDGSFVFLNKEDQTILRLNDLKDEDQYPSGKFVLKEISVPDGYRSAGEIQLYFDPDIKDQAILLSHNKWDTGAYAMPMVTVTLPNGIIGEFNGPGRYQPGDGLYFAVVLKKGKSIKDDTSDWYPVSGDPIEGWTVSTNNDMAAVLQAATNNVYTFQTDSSGAYSATIQNLPGDIKKYKYIKDSNNQLAQAPEYTIAYYHTSADTLADANIGNTVRVKADNGDASFKREFAVRLYVPNIKNMLVVQKVDDNGVALTGAEFTLTQTKDKNGNSVTDAVPQTVTTGNLTQANDEITLNGAAVFPVEGKVLSNGTYILEEAKAPTGYAASSQATTIVVDNTDVYANAGKENDDVTVLRGAGNLVRSMVQFAEEDDINTTLSDITATLYTSTGDTLPGHGNRINTDYWKVWEQATSQEQLPRETINLSYGASEHILDYGLADGETGDVYFEVDAGWSSVKITQTTYEGENPLKEKLQDQDLSNLFSRSTIVRVKNTPIGLTIKKTVVEPTLSALTDVDKQQSFKITIQLWDKNGNSLGGIYHYRNAQGESKELKFDSKGISTITLTHGQSITLYDLPDGTKYKVTEESTSNYTPSYKVQVGSGTPAEGNEGTLTTNQSIQMVEVTNTRKTGSVKISKTVTGDLGDKTLPFDFTLELKEGTTALAGTFTVTGSGVPSGMRSIIFGADGKATCQLKHDQDITISGLPVGATLTVTEALVTGYTTTVNEVAKNNDMVDVSETQKELAFVNNCNMQPPTGLHGETRPYAAMVGLAGAAALISIAGWVELRRRKRREQE